MSTGEIAKIFTLHELYLITTSVAFNWSSLEELAKDNSREDLAGKLNSLSEKSYDTLEKTINQVITKNQDDFNKLIEFSFKFDSEENGQEFMRKIINIVSVELSDYLIKD